MSAGQLDKNTEQRLYGKQEIPASHKTYGSNQQNKVCKSLVKQRKQHPIPPASFGIFLFQTQKSLDGT